MLTYPEEAADFVKKTGVDALAIAIGTSHSAYKFTRPPTGDILAIERVKAKSEVDPMSSQFFAEFKVLTLRS